MNLTEFLKDGGFSPEVGELLAPWWREDSALETMPEFLDGGFFREYEPLLGLRESPASRVDALVAEVKKHPALRIYANLLDRWLLGGEPGPDGARLPLPVGRLGEEGAGLFSLLLALAALPRIRKSQAELGLPESCWRGRGGLDRRDRHDLQGRARRFCRDESAADPLAPFFDRAPAFPGRPLRISGAYRAGLGSGRLPQPGRRRRACALPRRLEDRRRRIPGGGRGETDLSGMGRLHADRHTDRPASGRALRAYAARSIWRCTNRSSLRMNGCRASISRAAAA